MSNKDNNITNTNTTNTNTQPKPPLPQHDLTSRVSEVFELINTEKKSKH